MGLAELREREQSFGDAQPTGRQTNNYETMASASSLVCHAEPGMFDSTTSINPIPDGIVCLEVEMPRLSPRASSRGRGGKAVYGSRGVYRLQDFNFTGGGWRSTGRNQGRES